MSEGFACIECGLQMDQVEWLDYNQTCYDCQEIIDAADKRIADRNARDRAIDDEIDRRRERQP